MEKNAKIYVAGHRGLVGSALMRQLVEQGYTNIVTSYADLRVKRDVEIFFQNEKPEYVFLAAAKVGGITANAAHPASFIHTNLTIQTNVIDVAFWSKVKKLMFLGSACIYPKHAPVPIKEEYLLSGPLEETNIAYSVSKIAGIVMCQKYHEQYGMNNISVMPNNVYGIGDNFRLNECHVIPALIRKFVDARDNGDPQVTCYGDGTPTREFIFADDLADGLIFLMNNYDDPSIINIGPNRETSIGEVVDIICKEVGYKGDVVWDTSKPTGTPRRVLDTSKMDAMGWKAKTSLENGLKQTIEWYERHKNEDSSGIWRV